MFASPADTTSFNPFDAKYNGKGGGGLGVDKFLKAMAVKKFGKDKVAGAMEAMKGRPIMRINRPSQAGKFMKVAPSVAVPVEKMVM